MSLTAIPQDINKAALTIDLGRQILGNDIIAAEIPLDRPDMIKLCPMAAHLFNNINSDKALGAGALQNVTFARVGSSDRITLTLHVDASRGINYKWDPASSNAAAALINQTMGNPIDPRSLAILNGVSYTEHVPKNEFDEQVCNAVYKALAAKTQRDGGTMTILSTAFEERVKKGGLFSKDTPYFAGTITVKATGTCGGCSADSITFAMGKKNANKELPDALQVEQIVSHPNSANLLIRRAPRLAR